MAQRQQYETLPGKDISEREMSGTKGGPVVLSQPTKLSATEEYVLNLDPNEVAGKWRSVNCNIISMPLVEKICRCFRGSHTP